MLHFVQNHMLLAVCCTLKLQSRHAGKESSDFTPTTSHPCSVVNCSGKSSLATCPMSSMSVVVASFGTERYFTYWYVRTVRLVNR